MMALVVAAVPIAIVNELWQLGALGLAARDAALALQFVELHQQGIAVAGIFWGLWLLPFGLLVIRSGFMPKLIGRLLIIGCASYLVDSSVTLLAPHLRGAWNDLLMLPLAAGEISAVGWLLFRGFRPERVRAAAAA